MRLSISNFEDAGNDFECMRKIAKRLTELGVTFRNVRFDDSVFCFVRLDN
jgi:hypothetical protein